MSFFLFKLYYGILNLVKVPGVKIATTSKERKRKMTVVITYSRKKFCGNAGYF